MRWLEPQSPVAPVLSRSPHLLLQIQAQVLNGDWRVTLSRWYPGIQLMPELKAA